jgi:hypothetical protein
MNRIEEKEAYLVLQCLWKDFSNDFYSSESPDLKNDVNSVGIEITQSTLDIKDRISYIANKINVKPNKDMRQNLELIAFYDKDDLYKEYTHKEKDKTQEELTKELIDNTKKLISSKTNKFKKSYIKYKTNGLFVFIRTYELNEETIEELCEFFYDKQNENRDKIDILFLHDIENLYIYYRKDKKLNKIPIDEDTKNIIYNIL